MAEMVPKGPRADEAKVRDITTAKSRGGRPSGLGYDPATGDEVYTPTYRNESEYDVFGTVRETGYREDRFYTRSVNADGHGERITIRVPQGVDSQVFAAVSEIPEYRSVQDFFRDAAMHRLEYLQKRYQMTDGAQRMLVLERFQADGERASQEIDNLTNAVREIEEKCQKAWDAEDYGLLAQRIDKGTETVEWLREPYKEKAQRVLTDWRSRAREQLQQLEQRNRE